ncbi:hypothetical protein BXZ70DRAFT_1006151 [Cristinia sonorae]|uniref:Uncharacterized protein n=1 Tax=Cristinia sonorae TaxID=1940300 RepID=A0A8K0XSF2_9AGAR|nr:hypothetical protein BXZ70DRAFT_1006151 [Cristinia sonorae]
MRDILTGWPDAITKHQDRLEQEGITQLEACSPLNLQATSVLRLPNLPFHHMYGRQAGLRTRRTGRNGRNGVGSIPAGRLESVPTSPVPRDTVDVAVHASNVPQPRKGDGKVVEQLNEQDHAARQSVVQNRQLATLVKGVLTLQNEHAKPPSALTNPLDQPLHEPESREEFLANIRLNNFHPVPHPPIETTYAHTELVKEEPNEAGGVDRGDETVERNGEGVTKDAQAQEMEMQDGEAAKAEEDEVWRRETEEWSAHRRLLGGPGHLQQIHEERVRLAGMQPGWRDELAAKGYITLPPLPQGHPFLNSPASANDPRMTIGPVARPNEVRAATEEKMEEKQARPDEIRTDGCGEGTGEQPNSQVVLWIENQAERGSRTDFKGPGRTRASPVVRNTVLRTVRQQQADFASFINGVLARQAERTSIAAPDADEHTRMRVEVSPPAASPIEYLSEAEIDELDEDDEPWTNDEDERRSPTANSAQSLMMVASHEGDYSRSEVLGYPDFGDDDPMEGQMDWSHTNGREDSPNSDTEEKKSAESHGDSEDSDYQDSGSDQGQEEEGLYYYHPRYQFRRTAIRKERELGHSPMKGLTQSFPTSHTAPLDLSVLPAVSSESRRVVTSERRRLGLS